MSSEVLKIDHDALLTLCSEIEKNYRIDFEDYDRFNVKRGLRNADGTGVMAGITKICSVEGYYISDGERIPKPGKLSYRGYDIKDIIENCEKENRFGYEEVCWLLLFGSLPTRAQLEMFSSSIRNARELPEDFVEDMIMKAPSPNIMNKLSRSVLSLYSYDPDPDNIEVENLIRQSLRLISQLPTIMSYAYQVKRKKYYNKSMYIHPLDLTQSTAQSILRTIRNDRKFTDEEAKLLDKCLMIHAEHSGGNNSSFATRVLSSSGTDTYAAISAGIGSLKGPKHGGANIKVHEMVEEMEKNIADVTNENQVADYIAKIINRQAGDGTGLVYGMGHAVYTLSDPRAEVLKQQLEKCDLGEELSKRFALLKNIEKMTPVVFKQQKKHSKIMCANVDLYSGLVYDFLKIPCDLFTPLFAIARMPGWCAHRIEEIITSKKIIRPAYKSVSLSNVYVPIDERKEPVSPKEYIPTEERV
ncbi:MAG: citrate synthase [Clostridia bacterium]|nr:citrate synthase [Clostridia bacterium]